MIEYLTIENIKTFILNLPTWVIVLASIFIFMAIVGQWVLYAKCDLPGYSCMVPIWNIIIFLQIVGRPAKQWYYVAVPPFVALMLILFIPNITVSLIISGLVLAPWAYFMILVYKEVCQCFGKYNVISYVLIVLLNGMYLFNLALSQEEKYHGPVYGKTPKGASGGKTVTA